MSKRSKPQDGSVDGGRAVRARNSGPLSGITLALVVGGDLQKTRASILEKKIVQNGGTIQSPAGLLTGVVIASQQLSLTLILRALKVDAVPDSVQVHTPEWVTESLKRATVCAPTEFVWVDSTAATGSSSGGAAAPLTQPTATPVISEAAQKLGLGALGLGTLPLFVHYTDYAGDPPTETQIKSVLDGAWAAGVTFYDTADSYCQTNATLHRAEEVLGRLLPSTAFIATKTGMVRPSPNMWFPNTNLDHILSNIDKSRAALGRPIDLWQLHHPPDDKKHPGRLEEIYRAVKAKVDDGTIRHVGVCNANITQIQRILKIVPLVTVQNVYSLYERKDERNGVIDLCREHGIVYLAHGPLGGTASRRGRKNLNTDFPLLAAMAKRRGVSAHCLALAWLMRRHRGTVVPIPGARSAEHITDSFSAATTPLSQTEMDEISAMRPKKK